MNWKQRYSRNNLPFPNDENILKHLVFDHGFNETTTKNNLSREDYNLDNEHYEVHNRGYAYNNHDHPRPNKMAPDSDEMIKESE